MAVVNQEGHGNAQNISLADKEQLIFYLLSIDDNETNTHGNKDVPPIKIEAESYSYMNGIQTQDTSDEGGGINVGWIDAGDWLSYHDIDIPRSGKYRVDLRVASLEGGGQLQVEAAGGSTIYGTVHVPSTGGWQNWQTLSIEVDLQEGVQNIGIGVPSGGWNLNWITFTSVD